MISHDIIILAGGKLKERDQEASGCTFRSELPIDGTPMVDRVYDVAKTFGEPLVIGGPNRESWRQAPGGDSFVESLSIANSLAQSAQYLVIFADLPFLKAESIHAFLSNCDPEAGFNYPVIPVELCMKEYPQLPRTSLKLREGHFTGGNICLIERTACQSALPIVERAYAARKSPIQLGKIAGFSTLIRMVGAKTIPKAVTIRGLEKSVGKFLKVPVKGVITYAADIGTDIDSYEQYQAITRG
ncbi:MAG: nucleotidyltransferase family protein [Fimbriimonadaceae bacterium]|nr:MAG: nucleotidyltransferase family protein [Fimbriimonadaceae bacterium]